MEYQFRENKKEERSLELKETGMIYNNNITGEIQVAYNNVKKISLFSPMKNVYSCKIISTGGKPILLANRSYKSFDNFDYKNVEYTLFLKELHNKLAGIPGIEFSGGSSILYYFFLLSIPLIFVLLLVAIMLALSKGSSIPFSPFIGLLIVIPFAAYYMKKGKKIIYKPGNLPGKYIP